MHSWVCFGHCSHSTNRRTATRMIRQQFVELDVLAGYPMYVSHLRSFHLHRLATPNATQSSCFARDRVMFCSFFKRKRAANATVLKENNTRGLLHKLDTPCIKSCPVKDGHAHCLSQTHKTQRTTYPACTKPEPHFYHADSRRKLAGPGRRRARSRCRRRRRTLRRSAAAPPRASRPGSGAANCRRIHVTWRP